MSYSNIDYVAMLELDLASYYLKFINLFIIILNLIAQCNVNLQEDP